MNIKDRTATRGRFTTNVIANSLGFGFNVVVGIWYTPYLIHNLGTASYGIVPLANQIIQYLVIMTLVINSAVGRYMSIALEKGEDDSANRYFNTSLFGSLLLACILAVPAGWVSLNPEVFIEVPDGQAIQVRWLLGGTAVSFLLNTIQAPFGISTFYLSRFELRAGLNILKKVVAVGCVVAFFTAMTPQLWMVGFGLAASSVVGILAAVWIWRVLTPMLRISVSSFDLVALRELSSTGGWMMVNQIGAMLFLAIDLIVVNNMLGPEAGGRYAAVLLWSTLLRTMAAVIAGVFPPTIIAFYARQDIDGLILYCRRAVKCLGVLVALPIGLICGLSAPLLTTWLGPEFADLSWLMTLLTLHLSVNLAVIPLFSVQTATDRVRTPGIVSLIMGACNLGLAILLAGPVGWGMYGVAAAGFIVLTAKNLVFTPLYAAHILGRQRTAFFREVLPNVSAALLVVIVCKLLAGVFDLAGWGHLIVVGAVVSPLYLLAAYYLLLNAAEKQMAWQLIPGSKTRK